jgi:tetratricopeptide (TPR) repeat protein
VVCAEKIPFLLFSVGMVLTTLSVARHSNILASYDHLSALQRLAISGNAIFEYCRYMIYPAGILPLHVIDASQMAFYGLKGLAFVVFTVVLLSVCRKRRWPKAVLFCFLLPLLPVLAVFQNGIQSFASRFTYLPSLSPTIALVFCAGLMVSTNSGERLAIVRKALLIVGIALLVAYGITTWRFIGIWKSTETLWSRIIDLHPTGRAFKERGLYYLSTGQNVEAEHDLSASLSFAHRASLDEIYKLHALRGVALLNQERYAEAKDDFDSAIIRCADPRYFYQRGRTLAAMGKTREAEADFLRAGTITGPIEWSNSVCR